MALMARDGKYSGKAVISAACLIQDRLWQRVQQAGARPPEGLLSAVIIPDVEWVDPGVKARVKFLRGEPSAMQRCRI